MSTWQSTWSAPQQWLHGFYLCERPCIDLERKKGIFAITGRFRALGQDGFKRLIAFRGFAMHTLSSTLMITGTVPVAIHLRHNTWINSTDAAKSADGRKKNRQRPKKGVEAETKCQNGSSGDI